jgi:hypothetical protein
MSKQNKSVKSAKSVKSTRGRPHKTLKLPPKARFTITEVTALNGVARLTVYNQINDGTLRIKATKDVKETGQPGKPGTYFVRIPVTKPKARKSKLATAPAIDLTPAPVATATAPAIDLTPAPVADATAPVAETVPVS